MSASPQPAGVHLTELRLFVEEICCDLLRFQHVVRDGKTYADRGDRRLDQPCRTPDGGCRTQRDRREQRFFQRLPEMSQNDFRGIEPMEVRNIGRVKAWRLSIGDSGTP